MPRDGVSRRHELSDAVWRGTTSNRNGADGNRLSIAPQELMGMMMTSYVIIDQEGQASGGKTVLMKRDRAVRLVWFCPAGFVRCGAVRFLYVQHHVRGAVSCGAMQCGAVLFC